MVEGLEIFWYIELPVTTKHSVGFTWSCLPIGKNCHIIPLRDSMKIGGKLIEDVFLGFLLGECKIEFCLENWEGVLHDVYGLVLNSGGGVHFIIRLLFICCRVRSRGWDERGCRLLLQIFMRVLFRGDEIEVREGIPWEMSVEWYVNNFFIIIIIKMML